MNTAELTVVATSVNRDFETYINPTLVSPEVVVRDIVAINPALPSIELP